MKSLVGGENIVHAKGCDILANNRDGFTYAIAIAKSADIIILAVGEAQSMSEEAKSRAYQYSWYSE